MAKSSPPMAVASGNPLKGIMFKVGAVATFVAMSSCIKAAGALPAGQIVFFRAFFAVIPIIVMLSWQHELRGAWRTNHPWGHVARGLVGVAAMGFTFMGLTRLPLPDAITLNYAQPLLVVVFSAIFLGEAIRLYRWSAVVVGFIGVVIISWPKLTLLTGEGMESGQAVGVIAALLGAASSAAAMLLVRKLVQTERTPTIVLWFSLSASGIALLSIPFGWDPLTWVQTGLLVLAGIFGGVAQILMTESYRHAEATTVAPFEYTSMILSIAVGYFVFGDLPTIYTVVGGLIVVAAGIFIIWREHKLGLENGKVRKVSPQQ